MPELPPVSYQPRQVNLPPPAARPMANARPPVPVEGPAPAGDMPEPPAWITEEFDANAFEPAQSAGPAPGGEDVDLPTTAPKAESALPSRVTPPQRTPMGARTPVRYQNLGGPSGAAAVANGITPPVTGAATGSPPAQETTVPTPAQAPPENTGTSDNGGCTDAEEPGDIPA